MELQLGKFARVLAEVALGVLLCTTQLSAQPVVLESASLGATGHISGSSVTTAQFIGWRFQIGTPLDVDHIGGHLLEFEPGGLFAALVSLPSIDSVPAGTPFTADELVATTTFQAPFPSDEVTIPFTAELQPGSYALVFGTGMFGATGLGGMPNFDDQPDTPPTDLSSYIFWSIPRPNAPQEWRQNLASHMRFVVDAHVPIPGDYNQDGDVDPDDYNVWRTDFGSVANLTADGNGNNIVDGADYTIWRDHLGATSGGPGAVTSVPEPSTAILLIVARLAWAMVANKAVHQRETCALSILPPMAQCSSRCWQSIGGGRSMQESLMSAPNPRSQHRQWAT
jgi:hypothetical protein